MSLQRTSLLVEDEATVQPRTTPSLFGRVKAAGQAAVETIIPPLRHRRERREKADAVARAQKRMDLRDEINQHQRLMHDSARKAEQYRKRGSSAGLALFTASERTASERLQKAQAAYKPEVPRPHPGSPDWAHHLAQHAHDVKTVQGLNAVHVVGPKNKPPAQLHPHDFHVTEHPPEGPLAKNQRVYYTADKLIRGPLLFEGLVQPKPEPRRNGPGFTQRLVGRAQQALTSLRGEQPTAIPPQSSQTTQRTAPRKPRAVVHPPHAAYQGNPKAETQPNLPSLPGGTMSDADKKNPPTLQSERPTRRMRTEEALLAAMHEGLDPSEHDPHADWFKEPFRKSHAQTITKIIHGRRDPRVVARRAAVDRLASTPGIVAPRTPVPQHVAKRLAQTQVVTPPSSNLSDLDKPKSSRRGDTQVLRPLKSWRDDSGRVLSELVTAAGAFATGLKPKDPIVSNPRDLRSFPSTKAPGGAVTTRDVGHTANTGAWVPDKKKRETKPPVSKIPKGVWDPITKELEAQPSNAGGILTITRKRPKLLGG